MYNQSVKAYAAYNKLHYERLNSSSGGIFILLATKIISQGGVVYGVRMSNDYYYAEYKRIDNLEEIAQIQGSKYIQATMKTVYNDVRKDLECNRKVLFSGTPCQINGLIGFLGKDFSRLICVDIVCHGIPSKKLWKKYLVNQEQTQGKINSVEFRSKEKGWIEYGIKENEHFIRKERHAYMQLFLNDYCLRPSCYYCKVKKRRKSDITLGDFWGIDNIMPSMNDNLGTSVVIIRSDKGQILFSMIEEKLCFKRVKYKDVLINNPSEYKSVDMPKERLVFYKDLNRIGICGVKRKYLNKEEKAIFGGKISCFKDLINVFYKNRLRQKAICCGCTACMAICPQKAIHMVIDEEGFAYPYVNKKVCIGCNKCSRVCPFMKCV